ncbi:hypothetical protein D3C86_1780260 [compost metagenome]
MFPASADRYTRYPVALTAADQFKLIVVEFTAVAVCPVGAEGGAGIVRTLSSEDHCDSVSPPY